MKLRGLYAVTPDGAAPQVLLAAAAAALRGGARLLQYRDKGGDPARRKEIAAQLLRLCRARGVPFIVNDDVDLCAALGADGVHVGQADAPVAAARARLGDRAIVGVSCAGSLERARAAALAGASYVAFGRFFPSRTKPHAPPAALDVLREARTALSVPICAIGGLTPANAPAVVAAGADLVAAIDGLFGAADVEAAARAYAGLFP